MRKKIVAGNWKMNLGMAEGQALIQEIMSKMPTMKEGKQVIFCPSFTTLYHAKETLAAHTSKHAFIGAQNCHDKNSGAYTGEVSISMLKEIGIEHVIIGHSERRQYFYESNAFLKSKVDALIEAGLQVIFCCGEPLDIRESNEQNQFVLNQLQESLFHLTAEQFSKHIVIAYEPIWAIGTGKTASTEQAQEIHAYIRSEIAANFDQTVAENSTILYGGSCNASNAAELFACKDVDGGLIGGAALKAETFLPIIEAISLV